MASHAEHRTWRAPWGWIALVAVLPAALWSGLILDQRSEGREGAAGPIEIWGTVIDPGPRPVGVARVELFTEHGSGGVGRGRIDVQPGGVFRFRGLEPGIHHVVASAAERTASETIALDGAGTAGPIRLVLEPERTIGGRVTGLNGVPVEARILVRPEPFPGDPSDPGRWFPQLVVRSGPDGLFTAAGLPGGTYRVEVEAGGHAPAVRSRVTAATEWLEIRLVMHASLEVRVVGTHSGERPMPLGGADVRIFAPGSGLLSEGRTGPDGSVSLGGLMPGDYAVDASMGNLISYAPETVTLGEGDAAALTLVVEPGLALEGVVRDASTSTPVDGACIVMSSRGETPRLACATSDVKGRFRVAGLSPGKYAVVIQADGYLRTRLPVIRMDAGVAPPAIEVLASRALGIEGRVTDTQGGPVQGARVFVGRAEEEISSSLFEGLLGLSLPSLVPDAPGVLAVGELGVTLGPVPPIPIEAPAPEVVGTRPASLPPGCGCLEGGGGPVRGGSMTASDGTFALDGVAPGEVTIVAVHPSYAPYRSLPTIVEPGRDVSVDIVLDVGATIGGRVIDVDGSPVEDAIVWIQAASAFYSRPIEVGPGGSWMADHVSGQVELSVTCPGFFPSRRTVAVGSGESSLAVDIVLEPEGEPVGARILNHWAMPVTDALATISSGGGTEAVFRTVRSDEDGVIVFPALPGTRWSIVISHPSWRTLAAEVDAWGTHDEPELEMEPAAGVSGTVRDGWSNLPMTTFTVTAVRDGEKVARRAFSAGSYTLTDLPAGKITLVFESEQYVSVVREVTLPPGDGPAEVTLPDLDLWMDPVDPGA